MNLTGNELEEYDEPLWFCLRTRPKQEALAAQSMRRVPRVGVLAPHIRFRKATRRGPVWFVEALFPGYVFAHFHYLEMHRHIRSLPGVAGVLAFGQRVAVMDDSTISQLRIAAGAKDEIVFDPELAPGDTVSVARGPFSGIDAVVKRLMPSRERVGVLMEFLGRMIETELHREDLVPAGSSRMSYEKIGGSSRQGVPG